jgi:putative membrane protein (TIGR04086 family)
MSTFDRRVVAAGAIAGLFFALPAAILGRTVFEDTALAGVMVVVVLFSGALAGYAAARPLPRQPLVHGAAAGLVTFVGAQLVYLLVAREVPHPIALIFGALLFSSLGTIGAYVAVWSGARQAPAGGGR